jgi:hypothetical protein
MKELRWKEELKNVEHGHVLQIDIITPNHLCWMVRQTCQLSITDTIPSPYLSVWYCFSFDSWYVFSCWITVIINVKACCSSAAPTACSLGSWSSTVPSYKTPSPSSELLSNREFSGPS